MLAERHDQFPGCDICACECPPRPEFLAAILIIDSILLNDLITRIECFDCAGLEELDLIEVRLQPLHSVPLLLDPGYLEPQVLWNSRSLEREQ